MSWYFKKVFDDPTWWFYLKLYSADSINDLNENNCTVPFPGGLFRFPDQLMIPGDSQVIRLRSVKPMRGGIFTNIFVYTNINKVIVMLENPDLKFSRCVFNLPTLAHRKLIDFVKTLPITPAGTTQDELENALPGAAVGFDSRPLNRASTRRVMTYANLPDNVAGIVSDYVGGSRKSRKSRKSRRNRKFKNNRVL